MLKAREVDEVERGRGPSVGVDYKGLVHSKQCRTSSCLATIVSCQKHVLKVHQAKSS